MLDAVIVAGGKNNSFLSTDYKEPYEALIKINDIHMISFVADALYKSQYIKKIIIAGPKEELSKCILPPSTIVVEGGETIVETSKRAVETLNHNDKFLLAATDIPFLTVEAIDDFILQCLNNDADLFYPIITKETFESKFSGKKRTYASLKEGTFTGGNIFIMKPDVVNECSAIAEQMISHRKSVFKLCSLLGWSFVIKFCLQILKIEEVEKRVSELLNVKGCAILSDYPEIGIDVDKPSDLAFAREMLKDKTFL